MSCDVNLAGTVTSVFTSATMARGYKWPVVAVEGDVETDDAVLADLSVGLGVGVARLGAPHGYEN